jgi:histone H3/H4
MAPEKGKKGKKVAKKAKPEAEVHVPKGGIKRGSAENVIKASLPSGDRLSRNGAAVAILKTDECLVKIAKNCKHSLVLRGKKTLTHKILIEVLEHQCAGSHVLKAAQMATELAHRNKIANASVGRIIKKELGKDYRMSATALDAFSKIAQAELERYGEGGSAIAHAAGRKTVKKRDMQAVSLIRAY